MDLVNKQNSECVYIKKGGGANLLSKQANTVIL